MAKVFVEEKLKKLEYMFNTYNSFNYSNGITSNLFNTAIIKDVRAGQNIEEIWILVNAKYDKKEKKFKRINIDNFSFGWQFQADGTYPGEENFGDYINQGINLWKANGRKAYPINSTQYQNTGEDIGEYIDGQWVQFGNELGWQNHFMNDSYGGMTIGGSGFEIDGSGSFPYARVSHTCAYSGDNKIQYVGLLWNFFHGLFDADEKGEYSFFVGLMSEISDGGAYSKTDSTKFGFWLAEPNKDFTRENLKEIFSIDIYGNMLLNDIKINDSLNSLGTKSKHILLEFEEAKNGGTFNYPDETWNKNNTYILALKAEDDDGNLVQRFNEFFTFTEYGVNFWCDSAYKKFHLYLNKISE